MVSHSLLEIASPRPHPRRAKPFGTHGYARYTEPPACLVPPRKESLRHGPLHKVFRRRRDAADASGRAPGSVRGTNDRPLREKRTLVAGDDVGGRQGTRRRRQGAGPRRTRVTYDVRSDVVVRSIHVAGTLTFAPDRDTRLDVGLIKIQPGDDASEDGFDCDAHVPEAHARAAAAGPRSRHARSADRRQAHRDHPPALRRGHGQAVVPGHRLLRRPHGLPRRAAEPHLGQARRRLRRRATPTVTLAEPVTGWRVGDRVIVTGHAAIADVRPASWHCTEERTISAIDGDTHHARQAARLRPPRHRRLPRRGRQPEPQRRRRVGRPGRRPRPHDVPSPLGRLDQLRRVPPPRQGRRARPLQPCTSTSSATRCAAAPSSAPRSGTATIAG